MEPLIANVLFFILKIIYLITHQLMGNEVNNLNTHAHQIPGVLKRFLMSCLFSSADYTVFVY